MSHVRAPSRETAANRARVLCARELRHLFILFAAPVVWLVKAVVCWNERYTLRQRLQKLPDHMLKDIGISRGQIDAVVSGSLKRGPSKLETAAAVDYTAKSGPRRVADILGEAEAERLAASGARIIQVNVWRPIRGPVRRAPLALADASSVRPEQLIATDRVSPDRIGEIYHLTRSGHPRVLDRQIKTPDNFSTGRPNRPWGGASIDTARRPTWSL